MPFMFRDDHLLCILVDGLETFMQCKYNRWPYDAVCGGPASFAHCVSVPFYLYWKIYRIIFGGSCTLDQIKKLSVHLQIDKILNSIFLAGFSSRVMFIHLDFFFSDFIYQWSVLNSKFVEKTFYLIHIKKIIS